MGVTRWGPPGGPGVSSLSHEGRKETLQRGKLPLLLSFLSQMSLEGFSKNLVNWDFEWSPESRVTFKVHSSLFQL